MLPGGGGAVGRVEGLRVRGLRHRLGGARRVAAEGAVLGRGRRHQVLHHPSQGHLPGTPLHHTLPQFPPAATNTAAALRPLTPFAFPRV